MNIKIFGIPSLDVVLISVLSTLFALTSYLTLGVCLFTKIVSILASIVYFCCVAVYVDRVISGNFNITDMSLKEIEELPNGASINTKGPLSFGRTTYTIIQKKHTEWELVCSEYGLQYDLTCGRIRFQNLLDVLLFIEAVNCNCVDLGYTHIMYDSQYLNTTLVIELARRRGESFSEPFSPAFDNELFLNLVKSL